MISLTVLVVIVAFAICFYKWSTAKYSIFDERGIPYKKPLSLVGNCLPLLLGKEAFIKIMMRIYNEAKGHKVFGVFYLREPGFIIQDLDLIKKITVVDFEYFPNHKTFFDEVNDKLLQSMLVVLKNQRWKEMRNTLIPIFTAAKMRAMFPLVNECCLTSIDYLKALASGKSHDLEMREYFTRWSNDIIASTAFGLRINSYADRENEFYVFGQSATNLRGWKMVKFLVYNAFVKVLKFLKINLMDEKMSNYFIRLVIDTMRMRKEMKIVRPDMIHLLMEAKLKYENGKRWSDETIVAQCFLFFFAAFENNANLVSFACHELVQNPHVRTQLSAEILSTARSLNGGPLTYDALQKMNYLDMVISETLRKWPSPTLERECAANYTLTDREGNVIVNFQKGDLHYDVENFENPKTFDPERFRDGNKHRIKPFSYMPLGTGPRHCIGSRYAFMVVKAMLYHILLDFNLERSPKTSANLFDDIVGLNLAAKNGIWIRFSPHRKL